MTRAGEDFGGTRGLVINGADVDVFATHAGADGPVVTEAPAEGEGAPGADFVIVLADAGGVVEVHAEAVRLIKEVRLLELDRGARLLGARLELDLEILPGAGEGAGADGFAPTGRPVGD